MSVQAASARFLPFLRLSLIAVLCLYLQSCTDNSPSSPSLGPAREPALSRASLNTVGLELHQQAKLLPDGSVTVRLRARCPVGFHVVEGPITLMQGPLFQEVFGEGFFTTPCNGRWHLRQVKVFAPEGFHRGIARGSATLMVENSETAEFLQADDGGVLRIR